MSDFHPLDPALHYSMKSEPLTSTKAVSQGQPAIIVKETGKSGRLHYVTVNMADIDNLFLSVTLDDSELFGFSHQQISTAAAGRLALTEADCAGGMIYIGESAANGYSIVLDFSGFPLPFAHKLEVSVKSNIDGSLNVNGAYVLYGLYGE